MRAQYTGQGLRKCGFLKGNLVWNGIYTAIYIDGRQSHILGKAAGIKIGAAKGITDRVMAAETKTAGIARDMVGCNDTIPLLVEINPFPHFNNLSGNLVAEYQWGLVDPVPLHHIAAADAARLYPNQEFTRAYLWSGDLLLPDVLVVVVHGNAHV